MCDDCDVGTRLIASFQKALSDQVRNTLARRILAKVRDARSDPDRAARRWPFELIQNAHDAGPREGHDGISVLLELKDGSLRFQHDAAPFTMADIAALLTGGSSKDFDSRETTGRFGTGFLVTHVLSERVQVSGVLELDGQHRAFDFSLYRPDDEDLIRRNLEESESALGETHSLADLRDVATVVVTYDIDDDKIAQAGLSALEDALPHLFGSCRRLRQITIRRGERERCWKVESTTPARKADDICLDEIAVLSVEQGNAETRWRVIRASIGETASGRLIFAVRRNGDAWVAHKPGPGPSVFRQLPLLGSPSLPMWVIIDGEFDVDEERTSVHVLGEQGRPLREALDALGGLALVANREGWREGYRAAQIDMPEGLGETYAQVWREILTAAATELSRLPLVTTVQHGMLPAVQTDTHDRWADFISTESSGASHAELWDLAASCTETDPPARADSEAWSEIAVGWEGLGVPISWLDLQEIGRQAASSVDNVTALAVDGNPHQWLARYLDAVGKTWRTFGITKDHVSGLLPDQHGHLRAAGELRIDGGISDRVKQILASVGLDIKAKLLDNVLLQLLSEHARFAVEESTGDVLNEDEAIDNLVQHLAEALPSDQAIPEQQRTAAQATVSLLAHLWTTQGEAAKKTAWEVPLLAADGTARRAGARRLMVPPVSTWPAAAQPFATAYPAHRVLSDEYARSPEREDLLEALSRWGIAVRGLLGTVHRDEVADRGLRAIAADPDAVANAKLRGVDLAQLALLEPEVLNHCKQERDRAKALLGLVVCYVATADTSWRSTIEVSVRTAEGERQVQVTPSLWIADLRSKPWIPVENEEAVTQHVPNPELLRDLIDTRWLDGNPDGAELLVRHFDMDALDVRLLAAAQDEETRQRLRDGLAKIVEVAGDNPELIADLAVKAAQRKRDIERMRNLGVAVQASVKIALEKLGLRVEGDDSGYGGYDLLVSAVEVREEDSEDLSAYFAVGQYKVEVKATTAGEARLTPLQAKTAEADAAAFVLCVVDLRAFAGDVHQVDWATTDVSPYCRFVQGERLPITKTLTFVRSAEGSDVPIRNTTALRYAVQPDLWETGLGLEAWVQEAFGRDPGSR